MDQFEPPAITVSAFFPENFFSKSVNEPFMQNIMSIVLQRTNWVPGNPDMFEPDYLCDGIPFEFTIASNRKRKNNYIQRFRSGTYESEDVEQDVFHYIQESINQKMGKQYSCPNVHLCVLCLMNLTDWVLDEYGSITQHLLDYPREIFFEKIKHDCIESGKFNNVFIIFPDVEATWWVWDVLTNIKSCIRLTPEDMMSGKYPFWLDNDSFEKLLRRKKAMESYTGEGVEKACTTNQ